MSWHTIAAADELSPGQRKLCEVAGRRIALFRREHDWIAIDNRCPHRGGPVGAGPIETRSVSEDDSRVDVAQDGVPTSDAILRPPPACPVGESVGELEASSERAHDVSASPQGAKINNVEYTGAAALADQLIHQPDKPVGVFLTCPWHGLRFNLTSGHCHNSSSLCLTHLPVQVLDGQVQVNLERQSKAEPTIHRCLVRYGRPGHVGRFGSIEKIDCRRGEKVLVKTDRGVEIGEVLVGVDEFDPSDQRPPAGELLSKLVGVQASACSSPSQQAEACTPTLEQHNVTLLDHELTYDGQTLILYHAGEGREELGPLAATLAAQVGVPRVQFETLVADQSRTVAAAHPKKEELDMRGPYERTKYDFRRVWECPVCHHRERTPGSVTSMFCACQAKEEKVKQLPMKLIDDGPRRVDGKTLPQRKPGLAPSTNP
jgi:nitrite reductase/ring-hydroxylating ferredoxin subunit